MRQNVLFVAIGSVLAAQAAFAGGVKTANMDLTISGGATAGYFYSANTGTSNQDNILVSDMLLEIASDTPAVGGIGVNAGLGTLEMVTVMDGGVAGHPKSMNMAVQYGYLTAMPQKDLSVMVGILPTNVGQEAAPSFKNPHITLAGLWGSQPVYYPGVRATYALGHTSVYAEVNNDAGMGSSSAWAIGAMGMAGDVNYMASYYDTDGGRNIVDLIASGKVAGMTVGANFDFFTLDSSAKMAGMDDSAFGVAVYVAPKVGEVDVPVRVEFLSDGNSGLIGGVDSGYTFTVTPTVAMGKNAFVRAELSYVMSDKKIFMDKDGMAQDTKTSAALQVGYKF